MTSTAYSRQQGPSEQEQWADLTWRMPRPSEPLPTATKRVAPSAARNAARDGMSAYLRFKESGDTTQLDLAIGSLSRAVALRTDSVPQFSHLNNLANALVDRFELRWAAEREAREAERKSALALGEAVYRNEVALRRLLEASQRTDGGKFRPGMDRDTRYLTPLEELLLAEWTEKYAARAADLDEAFRYAEWAVWARPYDSPDGARGLITLDRVLNARENSRLLPKKGPWRDYLQPRIAAMASVSIGDRVAALRRTSRGQPSFQTSFDAIVNTLPRTLAWMGPGGDVRLPPEDTKAALDQLIGLALYDEKPARAVELFEASRGVLWDRMVGHTASTVVRGNAPLVARRLDRASRHLDEHGGITGFRHLAKTGSSERAERRADAALRSRRAKQQQVWDRISPKAHKIILKEAARNEAGKLPATLLIPNYVQDILPAAKEGPIVALLMKNGISAFIVHAEHRVPQCIELGHIDHFDDVVKQYLIAIEDDDIDGREQTIRETLGSLHALLGILPWCLFGQDYNPAVDEQPSRVWWCPSGPLAMLPVHAATGFVPPGPRSVGSPSPRGYVYSIGGGVRLSAEVVKQKVACAPPLLDTMVSSYTPTLRSLIWARERRDAALAENAVSRPPAEKMLLIAPDPDSSLESLPASGKVRKFLQDLVPSSRMTQLSGKRATVRNVKQELSNHDMAHFDCHSFRDAMNPWNSGLAMQDRALTVVDLVDRKADSLEFAFLAACTTALTNERLPDEMITLAAALHYTGCPHVIGTLTPSTDQSTSRVTQHVYSSLISENGRLESTDCARQLHEAVRSERGRRPENPSAWSPFIHIGI